MNQIRFAREFDMREPVKSYLLSMGFFPAVEFWLHGYGPSDIVAASYLERVGRKVPELFEVVAVELKLEDFAGVLKQAKRNWQLSDWSYIAMPIERVQRMRKATRDLVVASGVGLLAVGDAVTEVTAPQRGPGLPAGRNQIKTLWRRVRQQVIDSHANLPSE